MVSRIRSIEIYLMPLEFHQSALIVAVMWHHVLPPLEHIHIDRNSTHDQMFHFYYHWKFHLYYRFLLKFHLFLFWLILMHFWKRLWYNGISSLSTANRHSCGSTTDSGCQPWGSEAGIHLTRRVVHSALCTRGAEAAATADYTET